MGRAWLFFVFNIINHQIIIICIHAQSNRFALLADDDDEVASGTKPTASSSSGKSQSSFSINDKNGKNGRPQASSMTYPRNTMICFAGAKSNAVAKAPTKPSKPADGARNTGGGDDYFESGDVGQKSDRGGRGG